MNLKNFSENKKGLEKIIISFLNNNPFGYEEVYTFELMSWVIASGKVKNEEEATFEINKLIEKGILVKEGNKIRLAMKEKPEQEKGGII